MSIEILTYETTPLGTLCLRRRELLSRPGTVVTEVTLNHEFLMSSYLTESEQALARTGLKLSERSQPVSAGGIDVLVGGLGLGYTSAEVLKSQSVRSVEVIEYLPEVIGWINDGLVPLAETIKSDSRLKVTLGDVYERVTSTSTMATGPDAGTCRTLDSRFDLIVIDVDHSPQDVLGIQSCGFYTETGLQAVCTHLRPGGVLGVWSYADDTPFLTKLKNVFEEVQVEEVSVWNDLIDKQQTDWLFFGRKA